MRIETKIFSLEREIDGYEVSIDINKRAIAAKVSSIRGCRQKIKETRRAIEKLKSVAGVVDK